MIETNSFRKQQAANPLTRLLLAYSIYCKRYGDSMVIVNRPYTLLDPSPVPQVMNQL